MKCRFALSASLIALAPAPALAVDALIEGAKLCTRHLPRYEREYGIPTHLLSAIASTESGRYHEGLKIRLPWPWTVNAAGQGYYYDSKAQAVAAVKRFKARGIQSIDIGCMQVNLMHHPEAFASIEQAFEPQHNVAYAAGFLRGLYNETHSWKEAAGDYHSKTPLRGREYVGLVYDSWRQIIDKLRAARLDAPQPAQFAQTNVKEAPSAKPRERQLAAYQPPRMNSIRVTTRKEPSRDSSVIIIRPEIKVVEASASMPAVLTLAQAKSPASTEAKIVHIEAAPKAGPHFVFSD